MKKLFFLIVFAGLAIGMFYSCKKDVNQEPVSNDKTTYTAEEMSIWRNLTEFNKKIKSGVRDEEFITPDSAMWYLEALFNVQQGIDTTFNEFRTYNLTYELNVNNDGNVSMSDVISTYNQMVADLNVQLGSIDADYKYFIIGDLSNEVTRDNSFTMVLTSGFGINPLALYDEITSDDNWRYGNMLGKCVNTQWDSDAGQELEVRLNNPNIASEPGNAWINIEASDVLTYLNFPNRIYHEEAESAPCIPYTDLQYYLAQGHYIIYNEPGDSPSGVKVTGKSFKSIDIWTNPEPSTNGHFLHYYQIIYGERITIAPIED